MLLEMVKATLRVCIVAVVVGLAVLGAVPAQAAEPAPAPPERTEPMGFVVSGGVSEGAYQAGVMYALMKYLVLHRQVGKDLPGLLAPNRRPRAPAVPAPGLGSDAPPDFTVAAGASAGNINSFLAALTWCASDAEVLKPRQNLFWDSWINVGWDKLSPSDPRGKAYKKLFADPLSTGAFRQMDLKQITSRWNDRDSVYATDDGLVTRSAFAAVDMNLQQHLTAGHYRKCSVKVGLTATRAQADALPISKDVKVAADRFVVPLTVETEAAAAPGQPSPPVAVSNFITDLSAVGLSLALPVAGQGQTLISPVDVNRLVEASAAFPIAFGPVTLRHCRHDEPGIPIERGVSCPPGWVGTKAPFIDGGIFDNQPFGLAYHLAPAKADAPVLLYVDTQPVRHDLVGLQRPPPSNGIALVLQLLQARIGEARGYENLAAATESEPRLRDQLLAQVSNNQPQRSPQISSRFFPVVGTRLVESFGAFMHPSFRVHDYFVGVYDGIFTIAQALELDSDEINRPVSERPAPSTTTFLNVASRIVEDDADLDLFVRKLFDYERHWTVVAASSSYRHDHRDSDAARCDLKLDQGRSHDTDREDAHVAQVFKVLCDFDQQGRKLAQDGDNVQLTQQISAAADLPAVLRALPDSFLGDVNEWEFATEDRVVRRAIDVERASFRSQRTPRDFEYLLLSSRYVSAAAFEREHEIVDLDPSSVARISGGQWGVTRVVSHLLPYYLSWDPIQSRVSVGWEPKLRFYPFHASLFVTAGVDLGLYTHASARPIDDGKPTKFELRTPVGIGWDPKERLLDDLQLAGTMSSPLDDAGEWRSFGLELALHPLGSKLRFAVGLPQALYKRGGRGWGDGLEQRLDAWYLGLGLSDLNGSLYWATRWLQGRLSAGSCEEYCDGVQN
jgi:predicted acylesterase/phospholipase RssA